VAYQDWFAIRPAHPRAIVGPAGWKVSTAALAVLRILALARFATRAPQIADFQIVAH
jgi:hypothetical protein